MTFISLEYVVLFLLTFVLYSFSPMSWRKPLLLVASCVFILECQVCAHNSIQFFG